MNIKEEVLTWLDTAELKDLTGCSAPAEPLITPEEFDFFRQQAENGIRRHREHALQREELRQKYLESLKNSPNRQQDPKEPE